jgi:3-phosphoshikimate 1-carboxyvinyltransferase
VAIRPIDPLALAPQTSVRVPGSKSLTNRALLCASLSRGTTVLLGALEADDTDAMVDCLGRAGVKVGWEDDDLVVQGTGHLGPGDATLDARLSGTTSRFLLPALAASPGTWVLDGEPPLRARPFGGLLDAVRALGGDVRERGAPGCLPLAIWGTLLEGGRVQVAGDVTSQFVSALLLAGPLLDQGLDITVEGPMVSEPYVTMTRSVMEAFGVKVDGLHVPRTRYSTPGGYVIEPDASAASYFFAIAAVTGGTVTVEDLGSASSQGDLAFATDVLVRAGCTVEQEEHSTTVTGPPGGVPRGIDVDLGAMPDMAQTMAAVAVFADGPTRVRGVGIIRGHETDRIAAVVKELQALGIDATEHDDGFTIVPGTPRSGVVATHDDHRMAMAFTVIGLRAPGIAIADADCVAKTFPRFFDTVDRLLTDGTL